MADDADAADPALRPRDGRKVTINDIARIAEVSKKTVSRVINDSPLVKPQTRERIEAIIAEHGFAPDPQARALAFRRSFLIGVIYDNPSPQYVVNMQRGILDALDGTPYQLIVRPCDRTDADYPAKIHAFVERQRLFGVILPPSVSEDQALVDFLKDAGCPYVRIASIALDVSPAMIETHDAEGAAQAARHLAELGHTDIAHIRGPTSFRSAHVRIDGFTRGLAEHGLTLKEDNLFAGAYTFESGIECARTLLARKRPPTAVFCGNDEMAVGVYQAAHEAGLEIPRDISIVGFDDAPMATRVWPPLTTVRLPIREMGRAAAEMLIQNNEPGVEGAPRTASFTPQLIDRRSTGRPPSR